MKIISIFLFGLILSNSNTCSSQNLIDSIEVSRFSHLSNFRMGTGLPNDNIFNSVLNMRTNETNAFFLDRNEPVFKIANPCRYWEQSGHGDVETRFYSVEFTEGGHIHADAPLRLDTNLLSSGISSGSVFALGDIELSSRKKLKVQDLYLILGLGRPDLTSFKNLNSLTIQDFNQGHARFSLFPDSTAFKHHFTLYNSGDPFLMSEITKLKNLTHLRIDCSKGYRDYHYPRDLFLIGGLGENLFSSRKLKNIYLDGISFLPIDYKNMRQLDYFESENVYFPELLNLALLFSIENKDTSVGNWHFYLDKLVDIDKSTIDISTGAVKTYYKNGQILSEGEMIKDKPNGTWKFWYPDGKLCEERHYDNGVPSGIWVFRKSGYYSVDTTLILKYEDGQIIYRKDIGITSYTKCHYSEVRYASDLFVNEYTIDLSSQDTISITRQENVGTRMNTENWCFDNQQWRYEMFSLCDGAFSWQKQLMGESRQLPYYFHVDYLEESFWKDYDRISWSVDFRNCELVRKYFIDSEDRNEFQISNVTVTEIRDEEGICDFLTD